MLVGGAVIDRFSARRVLMTTAAVRTVLVGAVASLVWLGLIQLWELYALTFAFGVADAFSFPAGPALMPTLVEPEQLAARERPDAELHGDDADGRSGARGPADQELRRRLGALLRRPELPRRDRGAVPDPRAAEGAAGGRGAGPPEHAALDRRGAARGVARSPRVADDGDLRRHQPLPFRADRRRPGVAGEVPLRIGGGVRHPALLLQRRHAGGDPARRPGEARRAGGACSSS